MKKSDRETVRMKFGGYCAYCGCELEKGWCADHVLPVGRVPKERQDKHGKFDHPERDTVENLYPSCRVCNYAKSNGNIEYLRQLVTAQIQRARDSSWNFRMAEKYGLVQVVEKPVVFWFEKYTEGPLF